MAVAGLGLALLPPTAARAQASDHDRGPDWIRTPDVIEMATAWPGHEFGTSGKAQIQCTVSDTGVLRECSVLGQSPPLGGFGLAALKLAPKFRFRPALKDGKPISTTLAIQIDFDSRALFPVLQTGAGVDYGGAWLRAPTRADLAAVYPQTAASKGESGRAILRCEIGSGLHLKHCLAVAQFPQADGFGDAALRLVPKFQSAPRGLGGRIEVGTFVFFPINFDSALTTPEGAAAPPIVTSPDWIALPDPAEALRMFPAQAKAAGVRKGEALLDCRVSEAGMLNGCAVEKETPAGLGFGQAALASAARMQLSAWSSDDGGPVAGAHIHLPITFDSRGDSPRAQQH